jgi:ATP-dependent protease HslVU (ClpYQ) ATPase subunit
MVRDLVELSVQMVKKEKTFTVQTKAEELAEERILDMLLPRSRGHHGNEAVESDEADAKYGRTRDKLKLQLRGWMKGRLTSNCQPIVFQSWRFLRRRAWKSWE